jgi:hypothetical protein
MPIELSEKSKSKALSKFLQGKREISNKSPKTLKENNKSVKDTCPICLSIFF